MLTNLAERIEGNGIVELVVKIKERPYGNNNKILWH